MATLAYPGQHTSDRHHCSAALAMRHLGCSKQTLLRTWCSACCLVVVSIVAGKMLVILEVWTRDLRLTGRCCILIRAFSQPIDRYVSVGRQKHARDRSSNEGLQACKHSIATCTGELHDTQDKDGKGKSSTIKSRLCHQSYQRYQPSTSTTRRKSFLRLRDTPK